MQIRINKNESTPSRRRLYFQCFDVVDGITPETGEDGGQPQVSVDGSSWTNTGIGVLVSVGNGRYYSEISETLTNVENAIFLTRYKSLNTTETIGDIGIIDSFFSADSWGGTTASEVWSYQTRTITGASGLASSIWEYDNRTLTNWRQIVIDVWNSIPSWLSKRLEQYIESDYSLYRGVTNEISIISNVNLRGASNIVFSIKNNASEPDDKSLLRIESLNGLVILNGSQYPDSINGEIVVFDEYTGSIKIILSSIASNEIIPSQKRLYDIKVKIGDEVKLVSRGKIDLLPDITNVI